MATTPPGGSRCSGSSEPGDVPAPAYGSEEKKDDAAAVAAAAAESRFISRGPPPSPRRVEDLATNSYEGITVPSPVSHMERRTSTPGRSEKGEKEEPRAMMWLSSSCCMLAHRYGMPTIFANSALWPRGYFRHAPQQQFLASAVVSEAVTAVAV